MNNEKLYIKKFVFTVEGETEKWYLEWLRDQINQCESRKFNVSVNVKIQQSPKKYYKSTTAKTTPEIFHICDVESNERLHEEKFLNILSEMKEAKTQKNITYRLGYSNYSFELWMVLHKNDCNGSLAHRRQYLGHINRAFGEFFENLDQYKHEDVFKRCLGKLSLKNVLEAVIRADAITANNKKVGKAPAQYKGYTYYKENPALSIQEAVKMMLESCGVL